MSEFERLEKTVVHKGEETLAIETAAAALALARELDFWCTKPREQRIPPAVRMALKHYRSRVAKPLPAMKGI